MNFENKMIIVYSSLYRCCYNNANQMVIFES